MTSNHDVQALLIQAHNAATQGRHERAEDIFWRLAGQLQSLEHPVQLELGILSGLADACEARGKYQDAEFLRQHMSFIHVPRKNRKQAIRIDLDLST